jgi:glutamine synthetase
MRDDSGRNIFAVSKAELETGRIDSANDDTKYISREAEMFLAGVLEGLPDSESISTPYHLRVYSLRLQSCPW